MRRAVVVSLVLLAACSGEPAGGTLELRLLDAASGDPVPARVELLDGAGRAWVASDALSLSFECAMAPLPEWIRQETHVKDTLPNPHAGTDQFYADGSALVTLPPGRYTLRVFKGIEYRVAERTIEIESGATQALDVVLERWIDMPARGWWAADDHLHITRRTAEDDRRIGTWMRGEDLHVANLLQMGTVDQVGVTPQHDFGAAGEHRSGETLLLAGQEHPRTHFLGHTITLGADTLVDERDSYIVYETTWEASRRANGLSGFAHWGIGPARDGLAIDAPRRKVFFLEVLQFEFPYYDVWYELLDLGIRLTPTAGTDFPCGVWSIPGRERFYTRLPGPPTRASWLEGVRRGRTFVTNGPLVELRVGNAEIGDEIALPEPTRLSFRGSVRWDPTRDDVQHVELLENGAPVPIPLRLRAGSGEASFEVVRPVSRSSWYALRVSGDKIGETPQPPAPSKQLRWIAEHLSNFGEAMDRSEAFYAGRNRVRPSAAHTAPITVRVGGRSLATGSPRAAELAAASLERLDDLEARLADDRIGDQTLWDWFPYSDAVSEEHLRRNREALLAAIRDARPHYQALLAQ